MPGLFGYIDNNGVSRDDRVLNAMRELLIYVNKDSHKSEPYYHDDNGVHAGYCAPSFETVDDHTCERDGVICWFDGEVYNMDELTTNGSISIPSNNYDIKNVIITAYKNNALTDLLRKIDGYFSAVVYDREKRQVKLMIDRFGFRHLYYTRCNKKFAWASECKAFIGLSDFKINVDRQSVEEFMKFGMLCEDRTWLDGVCLLDPATVLTYDMVAVSIHKERYRSHDEVRPADSWSRDIRGYFEEWGRLFKSSVARRSVGGRTGVTLSGGLDSRAILAAMPQPTDGVISAVTLGSPQCDDARFATAVAKIKGADHHIFPLEIDGWLDRAYLGVWATDGALCISSQLGIEHLGAISGLLDVSLNGIGGGRMQGGKLARSSAYNEYDMMKDGTPGLQMERRRMLRAGWRLDESFYKIRIPFFDNDLHDLAMSIPLDIRKKGIFYKGALLHNFPEYYKSIPWQQAGVPISWSEPIFRIGAFYKIALSKIKRKLSGFGLPIYDSKLYFNADDIMRRSGAFLRLRDMLMDVKAMWPEYVRGGVSARDIKGKALCRIATFEVFMQQLTDPAFRPQSQNQCQRK